jgi:hypothetical protein
VSRLNDIRDDKYELRRRYASLFGVPDGGQYSHDWASRIDVVLGRVEELKADLRHLALITTHVRGCDEPDDPMCPGCVVASAVARFDDDDARGGDAA